jgi:hypothetical protein
VEATLAPRFNGGPYGPGDIVEGAIVATEPMDGMRSLNLYLRYVDRSRTHTGGVTHDSLVPFHQGPLAQGQEVPFSLRMPEDAYPSWEDPRTNDYGVLGWAVVMEADIEAALDPIITREVPIDRTGRDWPGPAPANQPRVNVFVDDWDVEVEPDRWSLRRGDELNVTARIGRTRSERPKLEVMLACQAVYKVEVREPTSSTGEFKIRRYRRDVFVEPLAVDPSLPEQSFTLRIPDDAPFSYAGDAMGFEWFLVAKEKRRWYQGDAGRESYLEVLP